MAEQTIQAYFRSEDEADGAALKLQALRADQIRVELLPDDRDDSGILNTAGFFGLGTQGINGTSGGGAGVVAASAFSNDALERENGGDDIARAVLTARVDENVYMQALHAIRESGGNV
ncbi:hypothetical protein ACFQWB_01295 [Paenibacillus thermoaerophilus]|uniref:Heat induced stress protein YflT n=1 Tax=Paenibacillus thermoaerophilus TaxID=1215385 RepID=A0ABW2V1A3_9BACL|nr:hypothetical protein [Paenibacillus thermoaerophilus]TMV18998.1 hypothetical protein FE781_00320 [Paenibacillus thermoaerophilus]